MPVPGGALKSLALVLLPGLFSAADAPAAAICAHVEMPSGGFPFGLATAFPITASSARAEVLSRRLVRIREGRFCLRDLEPGTIRLEILSEFDLTPMEVSYAGAGPLAEHPITVSRDGSWVAAGPGGAVVGRGSPGSAVPLDLRAINETSPRQVLKGRIVFPDTGSVNLDRQPILAGVCHAKGCPGGPCRWSLLAGEVRSGSGGFELPVGPCGLQSFWLASSGWALSRLSMPELVSAFGPAVLARERSPQIVFHVKPGVSLRGIVTKPDGSRFRPSLAEPGRPGGSLFWVELEDALSETYNRFINIFADEKGELEWPSVAPGFYSVSLRSRGNGFPWSAAPGRFLWVAPGMDFRIDVALQDPAEVVVGLDESSPASSGSHAPARRSIIGLRVQDEQNRPGASPASINDSAFAFIQDHEAWVGARRTLGAPSGGPSLRVSPGHYAVYLMEVGDLFDRPSVRFIAARNIRIKARERAVLSFGKRRPGGGAGFGGTIQTFRFPAADRFRSAASSDEVYGLLSPRVDLYDARGDLVGSAFASLPPDALRLLSEGLETGDIGAMDRRLNQGPRSFSLGNLPPGKYRVRASAFGHRAWTDELQLSAGRPARRDIQLSPDDAGSPSPKPARQ